MREMKLKVDSLKKSYDNHAAKRDLIETEIWKVQERQRFLDNLCWEGLTCFLEIGAGPG